MRLVPKVLRQAGFWISTESIFGTFRVIDFIGEKFHAANHTVENKAQLMAIAIALWLVGVIHNRLSERMAARLLGKLGWAICLNAALAPFVSGGQRWKVIDCKFFGGRG